MYEHGLWCQVSTKKIKKYWMTNDQPLIKMIVIAQIAHNSTFDFWGRLHSLDQCEENTVLAGRRNWIIDSKYGHCFFNDLS